MPANRTRITFDYNEQPPLRWRRRAMPTRTQQLGLIIVLAALVVYVFIRVLW